MIILKPFSIIELVARVQALLRRVKENKREMELIHSGPFQLDLLQENYIGMRK